MQEDVENRTINFAISTTKLTGRTILAAARKFLQWRAGKSHDKPVGKQSVKQLLRQDQGATNIEIEKTGIRDLKRILDKYGVDYAITKNHDDPPRYLVFFKARDADTLTAAFKDYSAKLVQKEKRPSALERLQQFKALAAELVPGKMREKKQENCVQTQTRNRAGKRCRCQRVQIQLDKRKESERELRPDSVWCE